MEDKYQHTQNGQEVVQSDLNLLGENSALADDRVLAELLRIQPYTSEAVKGVIPYRVETGVPDALHGAALPGQAIVHPNTGGVRVWPFRAIVGTRTAAASNAKSNWRDIRSAIAVGSTTLYQDIAIDPDLGGGARCDLIYAAVTVDADAPGETRIVKDPTTLTVASQQVVTRKRTIVALGKIKGTEGDPTVVPSLPADAGGVYYLPLAMVQVPAGFDSATVLDREDIWELAPCAPISEGAGVLQVRPASGQFALNGAVAARQGVVLNNHRPPNHMPSTMCGGESLLVAINLDGVSPNSHNDGDVVDNSRDWTKRLFRWWVFAVAGGAAPSYPWQDGASAPYVPAANGTMGGSMAVGMGQSCAGGNPSVAELTPTVLSAMASGSKITIYVDSATGELKVSHSGSPAVRVFIWLEATAQFPNS